MADYIITTEDSSVHWKHFNVQNKTVLDLGCGRWYTETFEEFSPVYFNRESAKLVIGIDSNSDEISYYQSKLGDNTDFIFETKNILNTSDIIELLQKYPEVNALKCDIEGHEKVLLELNASHLSNIDELAIEVHSKELNELFTQKITEWGFVLKLYAPITHNGDRLGVLFCERK
jgi:hypothetical protein